MEVAVIVVVAAIVWAAFARRGGTTTSERRTRTPTWDASESGIPSDESLEDLDVSDLFSVEIRIGDGGRSPAVEGSPCTSSDCWLGPDESTSIHGVSIPRGMIYVGQRLPSMVNTRFIDPSLVNPQLEIDLEDTDEDGDEMSYWPCYSAIHPRCRGAYLKWLGGGRTDPKAYIGYVFLFFYGLERRALHDAPEDPTARGELPAIIDETSRLLSLYSENRSFRSYAASFIDYLRFTSGLVINNPEELPPPSLARELPLSLKAAVGRMAMDGRPLDSEWAFQWARRDPEIDRRTPIRRCPKEFRSLFKILFERRHGEGFSLKPCKRTLSARYTLANTPASPALECPSDIPDVTALVGPRRKIQDLVTEACELLSPYSRWVGRNPNQGDSIEAAALLPQALLMEGNHSTFAAYSRHLDSLLGGTDRKAIRAGDALEHWLPTDATKMKKKDSLQASRLLEHAGFGMEPDVRFGGRPVTSEDPIVLFRLHDEIHETPTPNYAAASILLHLAAVVSAADGEISEKEERQLESHLSSSLHLDAAERRRLGAHVAWLLASPPGLAGLKKRLGSLDDHQRRGIGRFLVAVAWADGHVEPAEVKSLTKIYRLLDLDPAAVHQDLHEANASHAETDGDPVTVRAGSPSTDDFALPARPTDEYGLEDGPGAGTQSDSRRVRLDDAMIAKTLNETAAVSALLADIFSEDAPDSTPAASTSRINGLDEPHVALVEALGRRDRWTRDDFDSLAESIGVLPDGAIEIINEAAFERCDDPLIEGEDPIEVRMDIYEELVS